MALANRMVVIMDEELPGPKAMPDIRGIPADLVHEEMVYGHCYPQKGMPKTNEALKILGASQPYVNRNQ